MFLVPVLTRSLFDLDGILKFDYQVFISVPDIIGRGERATETLVYKFMECQ